MTLEYDSFITRKRFGQHFLTDPLVVENMVQHACILSTDHVVEVGPGPGILTKKLIASNAQKITSIEIDSQFLPYLSTLSSDRFNVIAKDALKIDLKETFGHKVKIIANLPYNIGSKLLINWLKEIEHIDSMTLMLQKEVVDRLISSPGCASYGRISVLAQWLCHIECIFSVPPESFVPKPKVFSSVVHLTPRSAPLYPVSRHALETLTFLLFHQRRKMLGTSLKQLNHPNIETILIKAKIDRSRRPETLSVYTLSELAHLLEPYLTKWRFSVYKTLPDL